MLHGVGGHTTGQDAPREAKPPSHAIPFGSDSTGNTARDARRDRVMLWITIVAVVAGILIRCVNPFLYDIRFGHDPGWHVGYLIQLLNLHPCPYYVAPYYYLICLLHGVAALPLYLASAIERATCLSIGVGLANLDLYVWYLLGLWYLALAIEMSQRQRLAWLAICAVLPVVHRSLNMVRPENLMLPLAMWIIIIGLSWARELGEQGLSFRSYRLWLLSFACALFLTQKVTGASLLLGLWLMLLFSHRADLRTRFRHLFVLSVLVIAFTALLGGAHRVTSGKWFFKHHAEKEVEYAHKAPLSFVTEIDPVRMWKEPLRNAQRYSMPGILTVDLFGDYWRYGISHYKRAIPREQEVLRARVGLVATWMFVGLGLLGLVRTLFWVVKGRGGIRNAAAYQLTLLIPVILAYAIIAYTAMFLQFDPHKGNLAKWEYLIWCLPFIAMSVSASVEKGLPRQLAGIAATLFVAILIAGVVQSTLIF